MTTITSFDHRRSCRTRRQVRRILVTASTLAVVSAAGGSATAAPGPLQITQCPALYVLGVDGTGMTSPTADPAAGTGVLGAMVGPTLAAGPASVQAAYVPYDASFGGVPGTGGTNDSYVDSMTGASAALGAMASQIATTCPDTQIAGVGYSQGAQVMSGFAADVGAGTGPIPADRVAGVALYSNPARSGNTSVLPGRPGQTTPGAAPGTTGAAVDGVTLPGDAANGTGIAADGDSGFGALTGRVAEFCTAGDLSCAAPGHAPLLRAGAALAAQASVTDPAGTAAAIGDTVSSVLTGILTGDVQVDGTTVTYQPSQSISDRITSAADPRTAKPDPAQQADAAARWQQIATAVTTDPLGQLPRLVTQAGTAINDLLVDNRDLLDPATWAGFVQAPDRHTSYGPDGDLAAGTQWFSALASDLTGRPR